MKSWLGLTGLVLLTACSNATHDVIPTLDPKDTPEVRVGQRLFRETRFAQLSYVQTAGDVNRDVRGEPVLSTLPRSSARLASPFAGQTMSCVACHMVEDAKGITGAGSRVYADFNSRTLIPVRGDGSLVTTRNTPGLVGTAEARSVPEVFHFDGEFATLEDLVIGGWTGRNFGWAPSEGATARAHVAEVLRNDNGKNATAKKYDGMPYAVLLKGEDPLIPEAFRVRPAYRIDAATADDATLVRAAAHLVAVYMRSLLFTKDPATGVFSGSPYDQFLNANDLPQKPDAGESDSDYADRLAVAAGALVRPRWVSGDFELHDHPFQFGPDEFQGLQIFLARGKAGAAAPGGSRGNCVSCHTPPNFTDFKFHNDGAAQEEFDAIHGAGAFMNLAVPTYAERMRDPDRNLPANGARPGALGTYRTPPSADHPERADLGLWNVIFNPDIPAPQSAIAAIVCGGGNCDPDSVLPTTIALFKTPGLRDLGHSDPYLHTGRKKSLGEVIEFYRTQSDLARSGLVRNSDPELSGIRLSQDDVASLTAFLNALDEDYE
jgi:cytochrome c peroxidase